MKYIEACRRDKWIVETWNRDRPEETACRQFRCKSWRHEGECRLFKGAQDFRRIEEAIRSRSHWCHLVLTYAQRGKRLDAAAFRRGKEDWSKLRKRLIYDYGDIKYIQTWEVHRTGWPHVHIAISNEALYHGCESEREHNFNFMVQAHAIECGFGKQGSIDALRSELLLSSYLAKLAVELVDGSSKSQLPVDAPRHFRRIRASKGLLPPIFKDPQITGKLLTTTADGELVEVKKSAKK